MQDYFGDPTIHFINKEERVYRNTRGDTLREIEQHRHGDQEGVEAVNIRVTCTNRPTACCPRGGIPKPVAVRTGVAVCL